MADTSTTPLQRGDVELLRQSMKSAMSNLWSKAEIREATHRDIDALCDLALSALQSETGFLVEHSRDGSHTTVKVTPLQAPSDDKKGDAETLADKIEGIQDDGGEGVPWSQDELDLMVKALRAMPSAVAASLPPVNPVTREGSFTVPSASAALTEAIDLLDNARYELGCALGSIHRAPITETRIAEVIDKITAFLISQRATDSRSARG
jgi:hypothetical protein